MIKKITLFLILSLGLFLGCVSLPTNKEILNSDYGKKPESAVVETFLKVHIGKSLLDPQGVQWGKISQPRKVWVKSFSDSQPEYIFGWGVCITFNPKNQFGGYSGTQIEGVLFKNGEIIRSSYEDFLNKLNGASGFVHYYPLIFCPDNEKEFQTLAESNPEE